MRDREGAFSHTLLNVDNRWRLLILSGTWHKKLLTYLKQFNKDIPIIFFDLNCKRAFKNVKKKITRKLKRLVVFAVMSFRKITRNDQKTTTKVKSCHLGHKDA